MAQNISLKKSEQSAFSKAVKNIKSLIKKNEIAVCDEKDGVTANDSGAKVRKSTLGKAVQGKAEKKSAKLLGRGIVLLSHVPPGFYEKEMYAYFSQFGRVTHIKMARSKKTGNPKGFAFIEFLYSEVAKVVAETMNNYLMGGRLLKAEYMPGGKPSPFFFKKAYHPGKCPRTKNQKKWVMKTNKRFTDEEEKGAISKEKKRLSKLKKELEDKGINLDYQVDGNMLQIYGEDTGSFEVQQNSKPMKTEKNPVLEIDESDEEVQFKVHPKVTVLKRKSSSNMLGEGQIKTHQDKFRKRKAIISGTEQKKIKIGKCNRKRKA